MRAAGEFMNISIKQYAKTLYKLIDGKSKSKNEAGKIIEEFVKNFSTRARYVPQIIREKLRLDELLNKF